MIWLKTRGYVAGDRKGNLRWVSLPEQIVKRKQSYELEITLTAAGPTQGESRA